MTGPSSPWRLALMVVLVAGLGASAVLALGGSAAAANTTTTACPAYNPPNTMTLVFGTPQSAKLGTSYTADLQVSISNSNGCQVTTGLAGIPVTFTAPSSGPSGIFASSGSNAVLVGTNASGIASAPELTANGLAGGFTAVASSDYGTVRFSLVNTASGVPATIAPVTANQSATVGSRYLRPLQATVLDANGNPVEGVTVTFTLGAGSMATAGASFAGGGNQATETTDGSGTAASPSFSANSTAGRFTATASTTGIAEPVSFSLDNLPGKSPTIVAFGKTKRTATVGARYATPLQVKVRDGNGKPLQGASVTFTLGASGGSGAAGAAGASFVGGATQAAETTNANGIAVSPRLTADTTAGTFTATATTSGTTEAASFEFRNRAGRPTTITAGAGASETTVVGTHFPIRLGVTVSDQEGNPVAGLVVTFRAPGGGASGRFAGTKRAVKVKTDAKGIAVAPRFVANKIHGGYVVCASAAGHTAAFALVNQPAS